jgi:hypothetical protein
MKKMLSISLVVIGIILVGIVIFFVVSRRGNKGVDPNTENTQQGEEIVIPVRTLPPSWDENDFDNDGISNTDEEAQGLDPYSTDTDGDTISDKREMDVFGTDPTKADTDGDGFSDFVEIMNGYNPLGEGVLAQ